MRFGDLEASKRRGGGANNPRTRTQRLLPRTSAQEGAQLHLPSTAAMAGRFIAQLVVVSAQVVVRAFSQAYREAVARMSLVQCGACSCGLQAGARPRQTPPPRHPQHPPPRPGPAWGRWTWRCGGACGAWLPAFLLCTLLCCAVLQCGAACCPTHALQEARKILNVDKNAPWEQVEKVRCSLPACGRSSRVHAHRITSFCSRPTTRPTAAASTCSPRCLQPACTRADRAGLPRQGAHGPRAAAYCGQERCAEAGDAAVSRLQ